MPRQLSEVAKGNKLLRFVSWRLAFISTGHEFGQSEYPLEMGGPVRRHFSTKDNVIRLSKPSPPPRYGPFFSIWSVSRIPEKIQHSESKAQKRESVCVMITVPCPNRSMNMIHPRTRFSHGLGFWGRLYTFGLSLGTYA